MENKLSCSIISDLLPSYIDEITNEVTKEEVNRHLESCERCKEKYVNLCSNKDEGNNESNIVNLKKKIQKLLWVSLSYGAILSAMDIFCTHKRFDGINIILDLISITALSMGIYFIPVFALFISVLWKKTLNRLQNSFLQDVIIMFLTISITIESFFLFWKFFSVL